MRKRNLQLNAVAQLMAGLVVLLWNPDPAYRGFNFILYYCKSPMWPSFIFLYILK